MSRMCLSGNGLKCLLKVTERCLDWKVSERWKYLEQWCYWIWYKMLLPHLAPSWILSYAENLASFNLQDGATEWYYNHSWASQPPSQPASRVPTLILSMLCGVPTPIVPPSKKYVRCPPHPNICFFPPHLFPPFIRYVRCPHFPVCTVSVRCPPPPKKMIMCLCHTLLCLWF